MVSCFSGGNSWNELEHMWEVFVCIINPLRNKFAAVAEFVFRQDSARVDSMYLGPKTFGLH